MTDHGARRTKKNRLPGVRSMAWVLLPFAGFASLVWFLVRILPKPSRAHYPCQRVAFPIAAGFIAWVVSIAGSAFALKNASALLRKKRFALALASLGVALCWTILNVSVHPLAAKAAVQWTPSDAANQPMGTAKGIHPGRVVWVYNPKACTWNGSSNYFWSNNFTNQDSVDRMVSKAVRGLTGESKDSLAWDKIFRHFNTTHVNKDAGYKAGENIAIKVNLNAYRTEGQYPKSNAQFPTPQLVKALLRQLILTAHVPQADIYLYDASRGLATGYIDPPEGVGQEFPQVHFIDNYGAYSSAYGKTTKVQSDPNSKLHFSHSGIADNDLIRLPTCVTSARYLINIGCLRGHVYQGLTLCAKNQAGSFWRPNGGKYGGWIPDNIHDWVQRDNPYGSYSALVDLMGHKDLDGKGLLYIVDGLYSALDQEGGIIKWSSAPFNNGWTGSIFVSQDEVALESVVLDFARNEPSMTEVQGQVDNYLHEAAQANNPPSHTVYAPNGDGIPLTSLGVHEHWNNATDKKYSRNLNPVAGTGIELYIPTDAPVVVRQAPPANKVPGMSIDAVKIAADRIAVDFSLAEGANAKLEIGDASGRPLARSAARYETGGRHTIMLDAPLRNDASMPPGYYIINLAASGKRCARTIFFSREAAR